MMKKCFAVVILSAGLTAPSIGSADPVSSSVASADNVAAVRCSALQNVDLSHLADAPTKITAAKVVAGSGKVPAYCQVEGVVSRVISMVLRMPLNGWNGRYLQLGCGGMCGTTEHVKLCDGALARGYACIAADRGYKPSGFFFGQKDLENNLQSAVSYGVLSTHVTAIAGKAIVQRYFERSLAKTYLMGCSGGGVEGMGEVQNFPWDFDGVVAGGPALRITRVGILWNGRALNDSTGKPILGKADLETLHRAVIEKCDLNDGIKDGLIGNPRRCDFKPQSLLCSTTRTRNCLTATQVEAVQKVYSGPVTSTGMQIEPPHAAVGSELNWTAFSDAFINYDIDTFRYVLFQQDPGPNFKMRDFDFDRDYKRVGLGSVIIDHANPDLRRFKSAGGKLLMYTGWNDVYEGLFNTMDYYESVERTMGGRKQTQDFYRLFVVPGMDHCDGGDGASVIDYLKYIEAWVERSQAPDQIVGSHPRNANEVSNPFGIDPIDEKDIAFSRPIYPYPVATIYLGHGDPSLATSFGPEHPPEHP